MQDAMMLLTAAWQLARTLAKDRYVAAILSFLIGGAAISIWPRAALWVGLALLPVAVVHGCARLVRERRRTALYTELEQALLNADPAALSRLRASNMPCLVVGPNIEVLAHPTLSSRAHYAEIGWSPDEVPVRFEHEEFDASAILSRLGGKVDWNDPPNGRKYCLVDHSLGGTDTDLSISLQETDWYTIKTVFKSLNYDLRKEFGSLDPHRNRIPHSLCLHFIVRCGDKRVLLLCNSRRKAYSGRTWSITAEEQLKESDLNDRFPLQAHFRRALLEEVFGLRDERVSLDTRWDKIQQYVSHMRLWSLFLEEQLNNFSLLGVYQLRPPAAAVGDIVKRLVDDGSAEREPEGDLYSMSEDQLEQLLVRGDGEATGMFSRVATRIYTENLHASSRYRMFRLLRSLRGRPLVVSEG